MDEKWKDIPEYEGLYQASTMGRIRSKTRKEVFKRVVKGHRELMSVVYQGKVLLPRKDKDGYLIIGLNKIGKQKDFRVHRLVAKTFIPNPHHYPCINHKDEVKTDNRVFNLEWCTPEYNNIYGTRIQRASKEESRPVILFKNHIKRYFNSIVDASKYLQSHTSTHAKLLTIRTSISRVRHNHYTVYGYHVIFCKKKD